MTQKRAKIMLSDEKKEASPKSLVEATTKSSVTSRRAAKAREKRCRSSSISTPNWLAPGETWPSGRRK